MIYVYEKKIEYIINKYTNTKIIFIEIKKIIIALTINKKHFPR